MKWNENAYPHGDWISCIIDWLTTIVVMFSPSSFETLSKRINSTFCVINAQNEIYETRRENEKSGERERNHHIQMNSTRQPMKTNNNDDTNANAILIWRSCVWHTSLPDGSSGWESVNRRRRRINSRKWFKWSIKNQLEKRRSVRVCFK